MYDVNNSQHSTYQYIFTDFTTYQVGLTNTCDSRFTKYVLKIMAILKIFIQTKTLASQSNQGGHISSRSNAGYPVPSL